MKVTDPHNVDEILACQSDVNDIAKRVLGSLTYSCLSKYFSCYSSALLCCLMSFY